MASGRVANLYRVRALLDGMARLSAVQAPRQRRINWQRAVRIISSRFPASQAFGVAQKAAGRAGIIYDSVRRRTGICLAIFKPRALRPVAQSKHYYYVWNGEKITDVLGPVAVSRDAAPTAPGYIF